jgi:hypothetical protein
MQLTQSLLLLVVSLAISPFARAADLAGKWTAEFDTQIGVQKYVYEFKEEAAKLTGKATYENPMGKGDLVLKDVQASGDDVTFVEAMKFNDMEVTITYKGKLKGDELTLTRTVGDFATEQLVAKRAKAPAAAPTKP